MSFPDLTDLNLNVVFDSDLRGRFENKSDAQIALLRLSEYVESQPDFQDLCKALGLLGAYQRAFGQLQEAERSLNRVVELLEKKDKDSRLLIVNRIRLAHVHHWQKRFDLSNKEFSEILKDCLKRQSYAEYLDFALQHQGKNEFDQHKYEEAVRCFEKALALRRQKGDQSLIVSTEKALLEAQRRIESSNQST